MEKYGKFKDKQSNSLGVQANCLIWQQMCWALNQNSGTEFDVILNNFWQNSVLSAGWDLVAYKEIVTSTYQ